MWGEEWGVRLSLAEIHSLPVSQPLTKNEKKIRYSLRIVLV